MNKPLSADLPTHSAYPALPPPVRVPLKTIADQPCPYLPGRLSRNRAVIVGQLPQSIYQQFMDAGFRRSGNVLYQPICPTCRLCVPIRVCVKEFRPSKSQRRCRRKNTDLSVAVNPLFPSDEKFDLYRRYISGWHHSPSDDYASFSAYLYGSPTNSIEFEYRDSSSRLLAVGICDYSEEFLSSVYFYFDPADAHRGLGTFGALYEIEYAAEQSIAYYYLGYWVKGCRSMEYKAAFRPCQLLYPDGIWRVFPDDVT